MDVVRFDAEAHARDLASLINRHLAAVVPGWGVPPRFVARLGAPPRDAVAETYCAVSDGRVVAALQFRRGSGGGKPDGQVGWFLADPEHVAQGTGLLQVARERLQHLGATRIGAHFNIGLDPLYGVPDTWGHCRSALREAGFAALEEEYWVEEVWGGWLGHAPPGRPEGVEFERRVGDEETYFSASVDGREVGHCACVSDCTRGGMLPALSRWGRLTDLWVDADRRRQGIATALVAHAAGWMRLAGCTRVVLAVPTESDGPEAQRFYPRLGWSRWARIHKVWRWTGTDIGG